ncbi:hypothetical protein LIA77_07603 [Sarocladium implicatum]|nr:hypothetical protein LIA77_07603 [Sarocladium implicatum]
MSIFSSIKKSRQSAKSHNAKLAEQKKIEESATPYRHVPTHAASDAFASAPPSWRDADKERIVEENRRRSAMAASGHHMNMPGTPRVGSRVSYAAYPSSGTASPMVPPIPRAYSHTGVPALQQPFSDRESMYSAPHMAYSQPLSLKGMDVTRWPIYEAPDQDHGYGRDAQSVAESSSDSVSSRDNLEMRSGQASGHAIGMVETRSHNSPNKRSRRTSDPYAENYGASSSRSNPSVTGTRDPRPPPSIRGFSSIPPSAVPPPVLGGRLPGSLSPVVTAPAPPPASSPTRSSFAPSPLATNTPVDLAVQHPAVQPSRASSAASLPGLTPTSTRLPAASIPNTPAPKSPVGFPFPEVASPEAETYISTPDEEPKNLQSQTSSGPSKSMETRRAARPTRFTELERIESSSPQEVHKVATSSTFEDVSSPAASHKQVVNTLPEAVESPEVGDGSKGKGKKSRKGGNKLVKKQRGGRSAGGK